MDINMLMNILVIVAFLLSVMSGIYVENTFVKYSTYNSRFRGSGAQVCEMILRNSGIYDVEIIRTSGRHQGYYNFQTKQIGLSNDFFALDNLTAIAASAHECGHAIQHKKGNTFISVRQILAPAYVVSNTSWIFVVISLFLTGKTATILLTIGAVLYWFAVLFMFATLPLEFDASNRAINMLEQTGIMSNEDISKVRKILMAAALTYISKTAYYVVFLLRVIIKIKHPSEK